MLEPLPVQRLATRPARPGNQGSRPQGGSHRQRAAEEVRKDAAALTLLFASPLLAQQPPYDVFPKAKPPYYRICYEAPAEPGELIVPVSYTVWIPPEDERLRGVIVHQHGCGEGSCSAGLTGAKHSSLSRRLEWQRLAAGPFDRLA